MYRIIIEGVEDDQIWSAMAAIRREFREHAVLIDRLRQVINEARHYNQSYKLPDTWRCWVEWNGRPLGGIVTPSMLANTVKLRIPDLT